MLLLAQPPSTTPYTAMLPRAKTKIIPTSTPGAMTRLIGSWRPQLAGKMPAGSTLPKGITAKTARAAMKITAGAKKYKPLSTWAGVYSALKMNFTPSASGWPSPKSRILVNGTPTRFGPLRS